MRRLTTRRVAQVLALALVFALGTAAIVNVRRGATRQVRVEQLAAEFGSATLRQEVAAEQLLRGETDERRAALAAARRQARSTLAQARGLAIDDEVTAEFAGLAVLLARYELAVDAEQAQAERDFALRAEIHDRQVTPAFAALQRRTQEQVRELGRRARDREEQANLVIALVLTAGLLVGGGLTARTVRQRALLRRAEATAAHEEDRRRITEASEQRFRQVVEHVADPLVISDEHGAIVDANPAAERTYGLTRDDLLRLSAFDLSTIAPEQFELLKVRVRDEGAVTVETTHRRSDGTLFPVEATVTSYDVDGHMFLLGAVRDISERRAAEEQVRRRAAVLAQIDVAVVAVDRSGVVIEFNPAAEALFERPADQALGAPIEALHLFERALPGRPHRDGAKHDAIALTASGRRTPVVAATSEIEDGEGEASGSVIVAVDVTEQRRVAAELARRVRQQASVVALGQQAIEGGDSEALLASAVEALRDTLGVNEVGVLERLQGGALTWRAGGGAAPSIAGGGLAAAALATPTGLRIDDFAGMGYAADPLRAPRCRAAIVAAIPDGGGAWGLLLAQSERPEFSDGDLSYARAVAHVLGAAIRREHAHELELKLERATRLESLGQLAGGIAHDFNNLLSVIMSFTQLAIDDAPAGGTLAEDLTESLNAARRASDLTAQLLAFSRSERRPPETIDVNATVIETQAMLRRTLGEHIVLDADLEPTHPRIELGRGQLEQILINLAVNARDAMPDGGQLTVSTHVERAAGTPSVVQIVVTDTGEGMPAAVQSKAFDPFFTTKGPGAGTGLGLATVYGIVTRAGGEVTIRSAPGVGTTVALRIPAADVSAAPRIEPHAPPTAAGRGELILVVEDEPQLRALAVRILGQHGYRVLEAETPSHAIELGAQEQPDLLLTDVVMPEMSGAEVADRLVAVMPGLRVIYMTGYAGDVVLARDGVERPVLHKPFTPAELLDEVDRQLHGAVASAGDERALPVDADVRHDALDDRHVEVTEVLDLMLDLDAGFAVALALFLAQDRRLALLAHLRLAAHLRECRFVVASQGGLRSPSGPRLVSTTAMHERASFGRRTRDLGQEG